MTDGQSPTGTGNSPTPPSPIRKGAARAAQASFSLVWLVPIIALVATLGIAWNSYQSRGQLISVQFRDATGITPGETALKFREITVGKVEAVRFSKDLNNVIVDLRVDRDIADYIDTQARFWIVRPQVSAQGISRLDTVLTGAFIEGSWDATPGEALDGRIVKGLERAPLSRQGVKGTWISLSSDTAEGLSEGSPVLFRGVQIARMENLRLSENGDNVLVDVFIPAPHDKRLTTKTVFWDTSGFSVSLGPQGLALNVNSLASLVQGGAGFATLTSGGAPVENGHVFPLQPDEETARSELLTDSANDLHLTVLIADSVKGLSQDADVQYKGLTVGRVTALAARVQPGQDGAAPKVVQDISISVSPTRLGLPEGSTAGDALTFLSGQVQRGLRARIASAGFLGTSLMIELAELPDEPQAELDPAAKPYPVLPAGPADVSDFTATAQGFLGKIGDLPLEETLKSASDMMNSVTALASDNDTRAIPQALRGALDDAQAAIAELRDVTGQLNQSGAMANAGKLVDEATAAASSIRDAATDMPQVVDSIDKAAQSVAAVDFARLGDEAEGILRDLRAMLGTRDAEELPKNLSDTLKSASGLLNDLRDGDAATSLNNALASARNAADQVAQAARDLPGLSKRLERLAARADATIAAYGDRSAFNAEAIDAMRELRRATAAFGSLARMIERNPRAFILGR